MILYISLPLSGVCLWRDFTDGYKKGYLLTCCCNSLVFSPLHSGGSGAQRRIDREAVLHVAEPAVPHEEIQWRDQISRLRQTFLCGICLCIFCMHELFNSGSLTGQRQEVVWNFRHTFHMFVPCSQKRLIFLWSLTVVFDCCWSICALLQSVKPLDFATRLLLFH